jgi:hypothetical protein
MQNLLHKIGICTMNRLRVVCAWFGFSPIGQFEKDIAPGTRDLHIVGPSSETLFM